jgi:hypothetical protein
MFKRELYFYGLCLKHYKDMSIEQQSAYLTIGPYLVPKHQIYQCCGKDCGKDCEETIRHKDVGKIFFVHGTSPSPPR